MQMNNLDTSVSFKLGQIEGTLSQLLELQKQSQVETNEHRRSVSERLEDMDIRIAALEGTSQTNTAILRSEVLPTVGKVRMWEQRGVGFLAFAGIAGTGIGAAMTKYGQEIIAAVAAIFRG